MGLRTQGLDLDQLVGSLEAEPGSIPWCAAMRHQLQELLYQHQVDHEDLAYNVKRFVEFKGWEKVVDSRGKPFESFTRFCTTPTPHGLGRRPEEIEQIIAEGREKSRQQQKAQQLGQKTEPVRDTVGNPSGANQHTERNDSNSGKGNHSIRGGNNAAYRVARLKRDHPEIAERLAAGEFKSVAAAERAAKGEEPHPLRARPSPLSQLRKWWQRASEEERAEFLAEINRTGEDNGP